MWTSVTRTTKAANAQAQRPQSGGGDRDAATNSTSRVEVKVVVMGLAGSSLLPIYQYPWPLKIVSDTLAVGKTAIVQRYITNTYNDRTLFVTSGGYFYTKKKVVNGVPVRLQLWDTGGLERFRSTLPIYFRGCDAAIFVYDVTSLWSFKDIRERLEDFKRHLNPESVNDVIIYIVGAKADLAPKKREVTPGHVYDTLLEWFPPPRPSKPPPQTLNTLVPHSAGKLGRPGELPTGTDSTDGATTTTTATASSAVAAGTSSSGFMPTPLAYSRPNEVDEAGSRRHVGYDEESSSGDELDCTRDRRNSASRAEKESEKEQEDRMRKVEADLAALLAQDDDDSEDEDFLPWGLSKVLEIREVSALDGRGIEELFTSLLQTIVKRRDIADRWRMQSSVA
ncbi:hypothetical protein FS837_001636 [Tulasnella sp. UAMH 9824]|nr:hypothetical protein FS837_001636 [Tulasnella sp. UAMH 9824]